jgi:hypothetical protein
MSSNAQNQMSVNKWLPIGLFVSFFVAIAVTTFYYAPSWGLMDDYGMVTSAREFKAEPWKTEIVTKNFISSGMLRPFFYTWVAIFYGIFEQWPTGFYVFIAACNMLAMVFWGVIFYHLFQVRREDRFWTIFFYPLTFFVFTPFWNIFNYLSLQEKMIVFFAPLAIYFFQKVYRQLTVRDIVLLYLCVFAGLMSKATFIYVPFVMLVYAVLDILIFRYRPKTSLFFMLVNGVIFAAYTIYTLMFQLQATYTSKYKDGLQTGAFLTKLMHLPALIKVLMLIGIIGGLALFMFVLLKKKQERSLALIIYMGLVCYIALLSPWGFQSYLISALAPLALGALFPIYQWLNAKSGGVKLWVNALILVVLCLVFAGNIAPSISRMGDIAQTIEFLSGRQGTPTDVYFMPPGYTETAYATGKFTGKTIHYCSEGTITAGMLEQQGKDYVILTDLFPSISLSGVKTQERIYANGTWEIFELVPQAGHEEKFNVAFKKTWLQQLKVKIRDL